MVRARSRSAASYDFAARTAFFAAFLGAPFLPSTVFDADLMTAGAALPTEVFLEATLLGAAFGLLPFSGAGEEDLAETTGALRMTFVLVRALVIFAFNSALSAATLMVVADLRRRSRP
jgi:hypothetical protein